MEGSDASAENKIITIVRFRPLISREREAEGGEEGENGAWVLDDYSVSGPGVQRAGGLMYDRVFGRSATNQQLFDSAASPIISGAIDGFNGVIFA